jgi:hypothetical protein
LLAAYATIKAQSAQISIKSHIGSLRYQNMPRGPCAFKQRDVVRLLRATRAAGFEVARLEIAKDGSIAMVPGDASESGKGEASNPWDEVLSDAADKKRTA